jgi:GntR family transcriptional repressor for pyruvate dehydrogenase complex
MTTRRKPLTEIRRVQRSEEVRRQLEAAIRRGDYAPGDRLPSERELVETFGVSRVSVREGIRLLEASGHVSVRHGSGVYVSDRRSGVGEPMTRWLDVHRDETLDLIKVRISLDALAAEEAAVRSTKAATTKISEAHEAFVAAVEEDAAIEELVHLDGAFHLAVAEAGRNRLLFDLLADLNSYLGSGRAVALGEPRRRLQTVAEHGRILAAVLERDPRAARAAMMKHLSRVAELIETDRKGP